MGYRILTKNLYRSLLCLGLLGLPGAAGAQVYKSYDADGNVVFSDKPTQGSIEVEISKPNLSDSFEIPSPPPSPPPVEPTIDTQADTPLQPQPAAAPAAEEPSADTNNDGRISRRELEEYREALRKARRAAKAAEQEND